MIVVAGGTGFIGAAVVRALRAAHPSRRTRVLSRRPDRRRDRFEDLGVEVAPADVLDPASPGHGLRGADALVGPEDASLNRFAAVARRSPVLPVVGDGRQRLAPVFVDDVAAVVAEAATTDRLAKQAVEVGGPQELSSDDVLDELGAVFGGRRLVHLPPWLPRLGGRVATLLPRPAPAVDFQLTDAVADTGALDEAMPDRTRTRLRDGLASYLP